MHDIAAKYRVVLAPARREGDMAGRMSRCWQNAQMIADRKIVAHDVRPPGFDHRQDAVAERRHLGLGVLLGPVVIFGLAEDVARLGKGWNPAAAFEPRIPADVIDMQMRAHHEIDVLDRKARGLQRAHIGVVGLPIPFRTLRPRLVVADATVDQDRVVRGYERHRTESTGSACRWRRSPQNRAATAGSRPGGRESVRQTDHAPAGTWSPAR